MRKTITSKLQLNENTVTRDFSTVGYRDSSAFSIDPFLNVDLFRMSAPVFPPHPHAGFSAVTYMLPESKGTFQNRDSFGDQSLIEPGDLHWTQAGAGMMHEETPTKDGVDCLGFQIFVNMSRQNKNLPPQAFHLRSQEMPTIRTSAHILKVVTGSSAGTASRLREGTLATPVTLLDLTIFAGQAATVALDERQRWFLFVISGDGSLLEGPSLLKHQILGLSAQGQELALSAGSNGLRALFAGGEPINEPVVWGGPFAMTSSEDVQDAKLRYARGEMGALSPSF